MDAGSCNRQARVTHLRLSHTLSISVGRGVPITAMQACVSSPTPVDRRTHQYPVLGIRVQLALAKSPQWERSFLSNEVVASDMGVRVGIPSIQKIAGDRPCARCLSSMKTPNYKRHLVESFSVVR